MASLRMTFSKLEKAISYIAIIYFAISVSYAHNPGNFGFYEWIGSLFNFLPTNDAVISHFIAHGNSERAELIANIYAFLWVNYSVLLLILALAGLIIAYSNVHDEMALHKSEKDKQKEAYRNMIPLFGFSWIAFTWLAATQGDCIANCVYLSNADFQEKTNYLYLPIHLSMAIFFFGITIVSILRVKK